MDITSSTRNNSSSISNVYVRIVYSSILFHSSNNIEAVKKIIHVSQINNSKYKIGGELTWYPKKQKIIQILEGPSLNVNHLFNIIKRDKRHENLVMIACQDITKEQRIYPIWSADILSNETDALTELPQKTTINDFQLMSVIGCGGFSTVVKATHSITGTMHAIKVISKKKVTKYFSNIALSERKIWQELNDYPFINKLYCSLQDLLNIYFVMEYAPRGDMFDVIKTTKLDETDCVLYFCEVLCGLKHIHEKNIIYRDLKLENILIDKDGHILLTDFGVSQHSKKNDSKIRGTPLYFSPEMITQKIIHQKNDIWALGIILFEMTGSVVPWQTSSDTLMFTLILETSLSLDTPWSNKLNVLLQSLTTLDYNIRPDCEKIVSNILETELIDNWDDVTNKKISPKIMPNIKNDHSNRIFGFTM
uniref:Protein kinase domain-containing protein n=1 Tax=viral metagenome TaxID=1070528 RepID=A0A6C0KZ28_9ZZZZ